MIGVYLTHPQVDIDPNIPVPDWCLSAKGRARLETLRDAAWLKHIRRIVASEERKAIETAAVLADARGLSAEIAPDMGENDRASTGFIVPADFEKAADRFFAAPHESWSGWERAIDAQRRIVGAVEHLLRTHDLAAPLLLVGHGAVGTLLKCHLSGRPIVRIEDQPSGGGNLYAFALADRRLLCDWTPMERFEGVADVG